MKNFRTEIKWGIIFSLFALLWMVGEKLAGLHDKNIEMHPYITMLIMIPNILFFIWALQDKRNNYYGGTMTFSQGFKSGLVLTGIITILSPLVQYIISTIITPDYFTNVINYTVEHGKMTREEAKAYFNLESYMIQSVTWALVAGIITSAVVAFFIKRNQSES